MLPAAFVQKVSFEIAEHRWEGARQQTHVLPLPGRAGLRLQPVLPPRARAEAWGWAQLREGAGNGCFAKWKPAQAFMCEGLVLSLAAGQRCFCSQEPPKDEPGLTLEKGSLMSLWTCHH